MKLDELVFAVLLFPLVIVEDIFTSHTRRRFARKNNLSIALVELLQVTRNATRFPSGHDPALNTAFHTHRLAGLMVIPEQVKAVPRLLKEWVRQVLQIEAVVNGSPTDAKRYDAQRAGGGCICEQCGLDYSDHPADVWEPSLTILCSRERVKL